MLWKFILAALISSNEFVSSYIVSPPPFSPPINSCPIPQFSTATGLKNKVYNWRGQKIRYIVSGPVDAKQSVLLVHGLFVNADHWRQSIIELGSAGYRTYAIDLLGSGYSSKPASDSVEAKLLNGENGRFLSTQNDVPGKELKVNYRASIKKVKQQPPVLENVMLGTASGGRRIAKQVDLRHPLNSCYNFYTWAEQISDFTKDIIFNGADNWRDGTPKTTSLVANSKGTIVALQAMLDEPEYYNGICAINPTYREMHHAEMRFPSFTMPIVRLFQKFLRNKGHGLYKAATRRQCIKNLLKEPYANHEAIDDELVTSLMEPLNLPNADEVVFDELSYTTGPLFEQLLQDLNGSSSPRDRKPTWVCYGAKDPWLSPKRVESLSALPFSENGTIVVDKVIALEGAGHCPMDETPETVNPILIDFLQSVPTEVHSEENIPTQYGELEQPHYARCVSTKS